jgi:hypothetical protein
MRYYSIEITDPNSGKPILGADGKAFGPYSSFVNGKNVPGALNVEFDMPINSFDQPTTATFVKIWGVPLTTIGQAANFNGADIKIYGGMQKGLPLANPKQSGLLLESVIQQAYGNWQGIEQSLDFQVFGNYGSALSNANLIFNWQKGQQMGDAITQTLSNAFPGYSINVAVNQNLIISESQTAYFQTVGQFAQYVQSTSQNVATASYSGIALDFSSQPLIGQYYSGIRIIPTQNGFNVIDGTTPTTPKQIEFTDLIGQPTWLNIATINFKNVMRADLAVGDYVKMPVTPQITTAQSFSRYRDRATFQGTFIVTSIRHIGHFKQKSADSWVTIVDAVTT